MNFAGLAPEINSLRMDMGAGSAPMRDAALAWNGLADELAAAASPFSAVTAGTLPNPGVGNKGTGNLGSGNIGNGNVSNGNTGPNAVDTSGFFNTAGGGTTTNGYVSGFFNTAAGGILGATQHSNVSGLLNAGSALSGLFSLSRLWG